MKNRNRKSQPKRDRGGISRRQFLIGSAAVLGGAALALSEWDNIVKFFEPSKVWVDTFSHPQYKKFDYVKDLPDVKLPVELSSQLDYRVDYSVAKIGIDKRPYPAIGFVDFDFGGGLACGVSYGTSASIKALINFDIYRDYDFFGLEAAKKSGSDRSEFTV